MVLSSDSEKFESIGFFLPRAKGWTCSDELTNPHRLQLEGFNGKKRKK